MRKFSSSIYLVRVNFSSNIRICDFSNNIRIIANSPCRSVGSMNYSSNSEKNKIPPIVKNEFRKLNDYIIEQNTNKVMFEILRLSEMNLQHLNQANAEELAKSIIQWKPVLTIKQTIDLLKLLPNLGLTYSYASPGLQQNQLCLFLYDEIVLKLTKSTKFSHAILFSDSLVGLSGWKVTWNDLSIEKKPTIDHICSLINILSSQFTPLDIRAIFSSMSALKVQWPALPIEVRTTLIDCFTKNVSGMKLQMVTSLLSELSKLNMKWDEFSIDSSELIQNTIINLKYDTNPKLVANLMQSLGRMNANWSSLGIELNEIFLIAFKPSRETKLMGINVSNSISGISKMKITWDDFNKNGRILILNAIVLSYADMNAQAVASTIY
eukprot:gene16201-22036_t